jgi:hypothetical protein
VKIKGKHLVTQHIAECVKPHTICTVTPLSNVSHGTEEENDKCSKTVAGGSIKMYQKQN